MNRLSLGAIFVVLSCSTVVWALRDRTPPPWDPADHIRYAYDYYRLMAHVDLAGFWREFFVAPHFYAPLVHLITAAIFLIFGASRLSGIGINLISLGILLTSVAWITQTTFAPSGEVDSAAAGGRAINSTRVIGTLAALIAACSHFSAWLMHDAFLDFPLTAAVAGCMALLMRAGDFRSRRTALQFAIAAGLGMLVKQTFAFFFALPAIYVTIRVLVSRDRRAILSLALAGAVIVAIAAIWYGPHLRDVISIYRENQRAALDENEAPLFSFDSSFYPIHALLGMQLQLPFAILFMCGLVYSLVRFRRQSAILYLWLASGLGMFALVANKDVRYTIPVVPAAATLGVCWLGSILTSNSKRMRVLGIAATSTIAVWCFVSFFNAQWPAPGMGTYINTPRYQWMVLGRNYFGFDHRPLSDDWSVPEVVEAVARLGDQGRSGAARREESEPAPATSPKEGASPAEPGQKGSVPTTVGVVVNLPYLNPSGVALYARLLAKGRAAPPLVRVQWLVVDGSLSRIGDCDYVLARTGLDRADWVAPIERELEATVRREPDRLIRVASFPIPMKEAEALLYRVERSPR